MARKKHRRTERSDDVQEETLADLMHETHGHWCVYRLPGECCVKDVAPLKDIAGPGATLLDADGKELSIEERRVIIMNPPPDDVITITVIPIDSEE